MFQQSDLIAPNTSAEAEAIFQQARAYDRGVRADFPDTIPLELRDTKPDSFEARKYYQQAAEMGHVGAMNNLAYYEQQGYGIDNDVFPENHPAAFHWNTEMARRGDVRGYIGMAGYYISGSVVPADPHRAETCLIEAARRDNLRGIMLLAQDDLKLMQGMIPDPPDEARIPRGIALMEEVARRGESSGFSELAVFYHLKNPDPAKREYYAREAAKMGPQSFPGILAALYKLEGEPLYDPEQAECLLNWNTTDMTQLEEICPRPRGPLTRSAAGLPPAPAQPYDLSSLRPITQAR